jgi:hypothetical protein
LVVHVQAVWRGYVLRKAHCSRIRTVATYSKLCGWPVSLSTFRAQQDSPTMVTAGKKGQQQREQTKSSELVKKKSPTAGLDSDLQPVTAATRLQQQAYAEDLPAPGAGAYVPQPPPRATADHKACAEFYLLYAYNVWMARELQRTWRVAAWAYERVMEQFSVMLTKNPNLKPMVESVAAQLKRGALVGTFSGTSQAQAQQVRKEQAPSEEKSAAASTRQAEEMLYRRPAAEVKQAAKGHKTKAPRADSPAPVGGEAAVLAADPEAVEYMKTYLVEMGGDDAQFKDIDPNVVPLSSGLSPPKQRPEELLQLPPKPTDPAALPGGLDVMWCIAQLKPVWLPIKAHRFTAYRSKVLQLLPQQVLPRYIEHEKAGHYQVGGSGVWVRHDPL